jgi:glycosyltransferase involved in cell wall biosynthesis
VELLNADLYTQFFSDDGIPGHDSVIGSLGWKIWNAKLMSELVTRTRAPGQHIVVHTFGDSAADAITLIPTAAHVESHVGYDRGPFGAARVFVSNAWRHFHWGKYASSVQDRQRSAVVLPYYDREDWPFVGQPKQYLAYMGRVTADKGISRIGQIARARPDWQFKLAGSGDPKPFDLPGNVECVGLLPGKDRAAFVGNAQALLCPTEYVEPCAGVVCEAALTGTPTVASDCGGFAETIRQGVTGYRASTLTDWIDALEGIKGDAIDRTVVREHALQQFTLESAAHQYTRIFDRLMG